MPRSSTALAEDLRQTPQQGWAARTMSEAFSPIMAHAALVLPDTRVGMIEPSATP